jgi:urease accessory protein UreE
MPAKRVQIDPDTWASVELLTKDRMMTFQELFDEAMRDLLRKHGIPVSLKEALSKSAARHEAKEQHKKSRKRHRRAA